MTETPEPFPDLMDTHQVARYLRVKERTIYDLLKDKRIPSTRVTGKWLFPKAEIDLWLKRNAEASAERPPMVVAGSHDPLLEWALRQSAAGLALLPGCSADGLSRFAAGEAALAGIHFRDNSARVAEALGSHDAVLIHWARRRQGLVVAPGNPLGIRDMGDLAGRRVVLRQPGAGSRALFDELVGGAGFVAAGIALTETEVGLAVLHGEADAGLAVESVARSLRLGFVAVVEEGYDLLVQRHAFFEPPVQALLAFARTPAFAAHAAALGGYDVSALGAVRWNAP